MSQSKAIFESPLGYTIHAEDYYENKTVFSGRSDKKCVFCGDTIKKGHTHTVHKFYPEFSSKNTHDMDPKHGDHLPRGQKSCTEKFKEALKLPSYY